jgi:hypothetical protein
MRVPSEAPAAGSLKGSRGGHSPSKAPGKHRQPSHTIKGPWGWHSRLGASVAPDIKPWPSITPRAGQRSLPPPRPPHLDHTVGCLSKRLSEIISTKVLHPDNPWTRGTSHDQPRLCDTRTPNPVAFSSVEHKCTHTHPHTHTHAHIQVTVLELAELYSIRKPSRALGALMDCVCILFGLPPSWAVAQHRLLRNLYAFNARLKVRFSCA